MATTVIQPNNNNDNDNDNDNNKEYMKQIGVNVSTVPVRRNKRETWDPW